MVLKAGKLAQSAHSAELAANNEVPSTIEEIVCVGGAQESSL